MMSLKLKKRNEKILNYLECLTHIKNMIYYENAYLKEIKDSLQNQKEPVITDWIEGSRKEYENEDECMSEFLYSLGRGQTELQMKLCENYEIKLKEFQKKAEEDYLKKGKLYRSLGIYGGGLLCMLLM